MKKVWETGMLLLAVAGFWGMIYPDLCFTQDVCRIVYEETAVTKADAAAATDTAEERTEAADGVEAAAGTAAEPDGIGIKSEKCHGEGGTDMFTQICEAKPEQLRIKFRLFEDKTNSKGKENVGKKEQGTAP